MNKYQVASNHRRERKVLNAKMMRVYLRNIAPSTLAFLLAGIYGVVDGLFVGQTVGDAGIAGISLSYPLVAMVLSAGTGIGMGGAVISSIRKGEGNHLGAQRAIGHTIGLLALSAPLIMIILFPTHNALLYLMGARKDVLENAIHYMDVIVWGIPFQILSAGCIPLIRNKGHVVYAMAASITGGTLNTLGNFVFVFNLHLGSTGAGLSTVLSQAVVFLLEVAFFCHRQNRMRLSDLKPEAKMVKRTLTLAFAPFALTLLPEVTTVALNISVGACGGGTAQAAFAVISYTGVAIQWMIQGVNDGSQPLISRYFGAGDIKMVKALRKTNFAFAIGVGTIGGSSLFVFKEQLSIIFGISHEATMMFYVGILLFTLSLPINGLNHAITSNFYAMESGGDATRISVAETINIVVLAFLLPPIWDACGHASLDGAWASVPIAQMALLALSLFLLIRKGPLLIERAKAQAEKRAYYASLINGDNPK